MLVTIDEVDFADVDAGLQTVSLRSKDLRAVFAPILKALRADIREHFRAHQGPDGGAWQPLAESTKERYAAGKRYKRGARKGIPLKRVQKRVANVLGRLKSAIGYSIFPKYLEGRALPQWAGVHEYGGAAGHGARIPQRSFMYASEDVVDQFLDAVLEHVMKDF